MAEIKDKRVLERELHRKGRIFQKEIDRSRENLPDLSNRVERRADDGGGLADTLVGEKTQRDQRIERIMSEPPPKPAGFPIPIMELED